MKAKLHRVAIVSKDAHQAAKDFSEMLGVEFYGPYRDEGVGLDVALPKSGGLEVMSPFRDDDAIGATQELANSGEGVKGIALRVDDIEEAKQHFASLGLKPDVEFSHGPMKEIIFSPQPATHGIEIAINEFPDEDGCGLAVARDMGQNL